MQRAAIRQDANNHLVQGLNAFMVEKEVVYDEEPVRAQAVLSTALTGNNNDIDYTAVPLGALGNDISIRYVDPGGATATLGVVVTHPTSTTTLITVNLGRAASAINTTGDLLKAALDTADVSAYVTYADKAANDGSGLVTAMATTPLAGGAGRAWFTVTGDCLVFPLLKMNSDGSGDGSFKLVSGADDDAFFTQATMASLDNGMFVNYGDSRGFVVDMDTASFSAVSSDISDLIETDTISGTFKVYLFWYPLEDSSEIVATEE